jgi:uncharacterized membrane protein YuzA (DUF378 family)
MSSSAVRWSERADKDLWLLNFDLVAALFGAGSILARVVYELVGLSAVYQIVTIRAIQRRWGVVTA